MKSFKLLYAKGSGKIRSCIVAKSSLNIFILSDFSDEDTVAAIWETSVGAILVISAYMAHDHSDQPPNNLVCRSIEMANSKSMPIIMGADANAHHTVWGSSDINARGSEPTFIVSNRREVLDITLVSSMHHDRIRGWRVSSDCSFSDHQYIDFEIVVDKVAPKPFINRRRTDWEMQMRLISRSLQDVPIIENLSNIENAKPCGSWTTSSQETLEVLMATHFPGCQSPENGTDMQFTNLPADTGISINEDKINGAINSFDPYKSPGPDGIIPADLQYNAVHLMPWLTRIYDACLKWSYIPEPWTKVSKAAAALYSCKRAIGKSWGINPKNTKWLFDMVVKPILLYGALVWWKSVQKDSHRKRFEGILRTSALLITGALRTTPSKALFVMMGRLPIDLMAQEVALNAAIRLNTIGMWHMIQSGHSTILDCLGEIPDNIDYCIAKPSFDRSFSMAKHSTIGLYWIPGHQQIPGNTIADSLAKLGSSLAKEHTDPFVGIPLSTCKRSIREKLYELAQCRWSTEATCRQARIMWPSYDPQRSQALFYIPRVNLRNLTAVVTGHWPFGLHARRLNLPSNDFCRSCQDEEEEENLTLSKPSNEQRSFKRIG
ncbi:uncharacterized protein LOC124418767 [Lucilia cuprina]|uniref:uncharacterized protein LOC124418767 n=1 Tax=Lucilia cuprina TaxID=7375 RepID=UPI001F064C73|nr:uncharacterized protein LOC124418767 [Lucilia cuprina]